LGIDLFPSCPNVIIGHPSLKTSDGFTLNTGGNDEDVNGSPLMSCGGTKKRGRR
jgi:hypothetical protein